MAHRVNITDFYKNKKLLVTGCTGFLGLSLVEKLLRSFPQVAKIYLLVRNKRGVDVKTRSEQYFNNKIFNNIRSMGTDYTSKIVWLEGDLSKKKLGFSDDIIQDIQKNINIVMHNGASVNFSDPLIRSIDANLRPTKDLLDIAKGCDRLDSFTYVSTTYCNNRIDCFDRLEERLYPHPVDALELLDMRHKYNEDELRARALELKTFPNTYIYAKNAAENVIYKYKNIFPVGIYRVGAISNAFADPYPGWEQSVNGFVQIIKLMERGYSLVCHNKLYAPIVPVDMAANGLIAATYDTAMNKENKFYNYAPGNNILYFQEACEYLTGRKMDTRNTIVVPAVNEATYKEQTKQIKSFIAFQLAVFHFMNYPCPTDYNNMENLWSSLTETEQKMLFFNLNDIDWKQYFKVLREQFKK